MCFDDCGRRRAGHCMHRNLPVPWDTIDPQCDWDAGFHAQHAPPHGVAATARAHEIHCPAFSCRSYAGGVVVFSVPFRFGRAMRYVGQSSFRDYVQAKSGDAGRFFSPERLPESCEFGRLRAKSGANLASVGQTSTNIGRLSPELTKLGIWAKHGPRPGQILALDDQHRPNLVNTPTSAKLGQHTTKLCRVRHCLGNFKPNLANPA